MLSSGHVSTLSQGPEAILPPPDVQHGACMPVVRVTHLDPAKEWKTRRPTEAIVHRGV